MSATKKSIAWSYPSSTNAAKAGYSGVGCWTVETSAGGPPKAIASFATVNEALAFARGLNLEWCPMFLEYMSPAVRAVFGEVR